MKTGAFAAAMLAVCCLSGAAAAGEFAEACKARLAADGRDASGCDCLEAAIGDDPELLEEMQILGEFDDPVERYEAASPAAKAAMNACTRKE